MPKVGDRVVVQGTKLGEPRREGTLLGLVGPLINVRWTDGSTSLFRPGPGAVSFEPANGSTGGTTKAATAAGKARKTSDASAKRAPKAGGTSSAGGSARTPAAKTSAKGGSAKAKAAAKPAAATKKAAPAAKKGAPAKSKGSKKAR